MSTASVDEYLLGLDGTQRATLCDLRALLRELLPGAEECISYGIPGYRVDGHVVAGFAAFRNHLSYFPHSGSVIPQMARELRGYKTSRGTLRFANDTALPRPIVEKLVALRLRELHSRV
ncbi:MAG: iron chaperone [Acidimicrobiales bacterium]